MINADFQLWIKQPQQRADFCWAKIFDVRSRCFCVFAPVSSALIETSVHSRSPCARLFWSPASVEWIDLWERGCVCLFVSQHLRVCVWHGTAPVPVGEGSHHLWPDLLSLCIGSPPKCQMSGCWTDTRRRELSLCTLLSFDSLPLSITQENKVTKSSKFLPSDHFSNSSLTSAVDKSSIPPKGLVHISCPKAQL